MDGTFPVHCTFILYSEERDAGVLNRQSLIGRRAWRIAAPGVFVLSAAFLTAGSAVAQDGAAPASERRPQDGQDDLATSSRGSGQLAASQQDLDSSMADRILGPPAPAAGEAVSRDADGRVTLRAFRLSEPLTVDGVLDDPVYDQVPAAEGFMQQEPNEGAPVSESTRVWVLYDADSLYVAADLEQEHPELLRANEMRRDNRNIGWGDSFSVILDTFYDRRNGVLFHTNASGALYDAQVTDERNTNADWNTVWWVRTRRLADRWTVEIRIPFRSLRYAAGGAQLWGINFRRLIKHRNERSFLTPTPQAYDRFGLLRLSNAATLVGLEAPPGSRRMELKPYAIGSQSNAPLRDINDEWSGDVGADFKFGVTDGLTADVTWNTDFAQVEDDETQVNLSRFSLFYPEKREFFLEGQGVFDFGGRETRFFGGPTDVPIPFFSRSIGISGGSAVPIIGGARLHGRAGAYQMGLMNIQTGEVGGLDVESTNFSAFRVKRDLFARSNIGVIATHRNISADGSGSNSLYGVDGNFAPTENIRFKTFYMATSEPTVETGHQAASYMGQFNYDTDLIDIEFQRLYLGEDFNPGMGFVRRRDFTKNGGSFLFGPRPRSIEAVRQIEFEVEANQYDRPDGEMETREYTFDTSIIFESSDRLMFDHTVIEERLLEGFNLSDEVAVPAGNYKFARTGVRVRMGSHRKVSGMFRYEFGDFFGGTRQEVSYWGRAELNQRFSLEPNISLNWITVPGGDVTAQVSRLRATYTVSPRSFLGALVQYNSAAQLFSANVRFRWEYSPGSDLFVVFSSNRDGDDGLSGLSDRAVVVKFTRLFRF
ncbi:MAG: carbohydrate binding family 9 domain-containing protein [Acidobacteria bacterium]|nr:carbohydrate binding family 9 domain-containing protein [Acidobacteriota bacterium]MYF14920.1 carbohydrate binding family 9 domain-containing protein [Acidobacteriota bacterium]